MLCELGDEARYVRSGDKCLLCDGEQESTMMLIIAIFGVLLCGVVGYILHRAAKSFEQVRMAVSVGRTEERSQTAT